MSDEERSFVIVPIGRDLVTDLKLYFVEVGPFDGDREASSWFVEMTEAQAIEVGDLLADKFLEYAPYVGPVVAETYEDFWEDWGREHLT